MAGYLKKQLAIDSRLSQISFALLSCVGQTYLYLRMNSQRGEEFGSSISSPTHGRLISGEKT